MNSFTPWIITGGLVLTIASNLGTGFFAYKAGKKSERLVWESANIETLISTNTNLADILDKKDGEFYFTQKQDIKAGKDIGDQTKTVKDRIQYVPIKEIITVEVPADCDATDINISYDTLQLFNSWSAGNSLGETLQEPTTSDVPLVGASEMRGYPAKDKPK